MKINDPLLRSILEKLQRINCLTRCIVILNIGFVILVPFIPTFGLKIGVPAVQIGYIISGVMIGRMVSVPNAGAISDKIGRKQVMIA